jgi:predicted SAM-dependent methyltransferase
LAQERSLSFFNLFRFIMPISILSEQYPQTVRGSFKFEFISWVGGLLYRSKPNNKFEKKYLNLGCGLSYYPNWTNADFYHLPIKFWKKQARKTPDWMLDIRRPLNCHDQYWDGIFTEHTLEHITHAECMRLFKEMHRTLKTGAYLRIIVPDIKKAIEFYNDRTKHEYFVSNFETGAEAIWEVTQNYYHKSVWDAELMIKFLLEVGFKDVVEQSFSRGSLPDILQDNPDRQPYSLYIEAKK